MLSGKTYCVKRIAQLRFTQYVLAFIIAIKTMPKQTLTGTLDEQCEFLYSMAQEKIAQGNFTGAVHTLQEIYKYAPQYRDVAALLTEAKRQKSTQNLLLVTTFLGATLFVGIGTFLKLPNDFLFLLLAVVGAVIGFGVGNFAILPILR